MTINQQGLNLFAYFFGDMLAMDWPSRLNFDFMLNLSALWTTWRNQFMPQAYGLGALAFFLGAPFICAYLLILGYQDDGDMKVVLLGADRATA